MDNVFAQRDFPGLYALAQRLNHLHQRMLIHSNHHETMVNLIEDLRLESETLGHGLDKALAHSQAECGAMALQH